MDYTRDLETHACTIYFLGGICCFGKQSAVGSHELNYESNVHTRLRSNTYTISLQGPDMNKYLSYNGLL
jgi:hypothetical protein